MENKERLERKICWDIYKCLHGVVPYDDIGTVTYELSFLRYLSLRTFMQISSMENKCSLGTFIDLYTSYLNTLVSEDILAQELECINKDNVKDATSILNLAKEVLEDLRRFQYSLNDISSLINLYCSYDTVAFKNIMTMDLYENSRFTFQTPEVTCRLINSILDIDKNDEVLDICSAYGNYLISVNNYCDYKKLTGVEIKESLSLISKIRLAVLSNNYEIITNDLFNLDFNQKFDKVFCNYPWGYRVEKYQLDFIKEKMNDMRFNWNRISNSSFDWSFIDIMLTMMKDSGKAATIMTPGPLFKVSDELFRKDLIDNKLIESIIKLPVFTKYTTIDQYLIIFSKDNEKIKFVDLASQCSKSLSGNSLLPMNLVVEMIETNNDNKYIKFVSNEEISNNGYLLNLENYIDKKEVKYYNPTKLSDYILDVFRGYQMTSKEQESLQDEDGNYEILMISDINDGEISENLTRIRTEEKKYDRYLLRENDLIISSKGTRIKIAVVDNIADRKIIANGNLIVLRLDTKKLNPYYLETFLNSSSGQTILNQIQTGSVIISINPSRLTEITISTLPIEKQNEIAEKYISRKKQISLAKTHLYNLQLKQENFFDDEVMEMFN